MIDKTLIYIDPGFKADMGHFVRLGELTREEARASNIELQHFVSLDVPQEKADTLGLIRRFKYIAGLYWVEEPIEALRDFHIRLDEILYELIKVENRHAYEIFMYTAHPLHLPIIAFLLSKYSGRVRSLSAHICLFYLDLGFCLGENGTDEYKYMLKRISRLIELFDPGSLMTVCADSERIKQLYDPHFERELKILPLPLGSVRSVPVKEKAEEKGKIIVGYIGQTTKRAGYHLVYQAYKQISKMEIFNKIRFTVKHTPREPLADIYQKFLGESQNITHINDFLSDAAYEEFFSYCDIILVPHSKKHYPCQTSGIIVDGLLRSKVLIVPEDTWMSDQMKDYGSGETFVSDDLNSFVQAVEKVINNFEYYREKANVNFDKFRNIHSCANFFREIGLRETKLQEEDKKAPITMDFRIEPLEELIEYEFLLQEKEKKIRAMQDSWRWKITAPPEKLRGWVRRLRSMFHSNKEKGLI